MTEIEKKALALVNDVLNERGNYTLYASISRASDPRHEVICSLIEQHEAYKQDVSDAIMADTDYQISHNAIPQYRTNIVRFIIPKPTVDPLIEALTKAGWGMPETNAKELRAALGAVGFKIVEVER